MCFLSGCKTGFFVFVCLTLEFTIYYCGTSKLAYSLGPNNLVKVHTYIRTFTSLLGPKTFCSHFFRSKNKTALIPSFTLPLTFHLMPPDFLTQERKKIQFFGKIDSEKIQKNFIVNNNYKIICAWYLSSK